MSTANIATGCAGYDCVASDPWPLHHVRHRGTFIRLCTSCVLKHHPGSFCCLCFASLDAGALPPPEPEEEDDDDDEASPVIHCSKCPSASHLLCLPDPDLAPNFVCPICENQDGFTFFPVEDNRIDLPAARVLLAAARLSAGSMSRAVTVMSEEAEHKAREAAMARKRARETVVRAIVLSEKEREKMKESPSVELPKKKKPTALATAEAMPPSALRRVKNREVDKWMRFREMGAHSSGTEKDTGKDEKGAHLPRPTQDALCLRTNSRVIFTGSPKTASLHS